MIRCVDLIVQQLVVHLVVEIIVIAVEIIAANLRFIDTNSPELNVRIKEIVHQIKVKLNPRH